MNPRSPHLLALALAAALLACQSPDSVRTIPAGQLYFPTGMFFTPGATQDQGSLYVASSNFDRRYFEGRITGIRVADMGLPAFPAAPTDPIEIQSLGTISEKWIPSLAGDVGGVANGAGGTRLLIPTRSEESRLVIADAVDEQVTCADPLATTDCTVGSLSLEANRLSTSGIPRAPAPFSVSIAPGGDAFIAALQDADSPAGSQKNPNCYTVHLNALAPVVNNSSFISFGTPISTSAVTLGSRYAYYSGAAGLALRLLDRTALNFFTAQVEANFNLLGTRGLALSPDESRLYLVGRQPDVLLVMQINGPTTDAPVLTLIHDQLMPTGASLVTAIGRPGRGNIALVTSVGTQTLDAAGADKGSLLVWDDDAGRVVAEMDGFGYQPYGIAVQPIGAGMRIYVGLFAEGRIAVFDMADLGRPHELSLVGLVGTSSICTVNPSAFGCTQP